MKRVVMFMLLIAAGIICLLINFRLNSRSNLTRIKQQIEERNSSTLLSK